jgi:hypothetical protein
MAMSLYIAEVRHNERSSPYRPQQTGCESSVEFEATLALCDPQSSDYGGASLFTDLVTNIEDESYVVMYHAVEHHSGPAGVSWP